MVLAAQLGAQHCVNAALREVDSLLEVLGKLRSTLDNLDTSAADVDSDTLLGLAESVPDTFTVSQHLNNAYYILYDEEYR